MEVWMQPEVSPIEIELLLLLFAFSDQHGNVDIPTATSWAKNKLGVILQEKPFTIKQLHLDVLMDHGALPDIRELIERIKG